VKLVHKPAGQTETPEDIKNLSPHPGFKNLHAGLTLQSNDLPFVNQIQKQIIFFQHKIKRRLSENFTYFSGI
jgi:hypothetical protein